LREQGFGGLDVFARAASEVWLHNCVSERFGCSARPGERQLPEYSDEHPIVFNRALLKSHAVKFLRILGLIF
jgi:hypothetical protein